MTTNWAEIFGVDEWAWITKLGASYRDPEEKRVFWETVRDKKQADPSYSVFTDFPRDHAALEVDPAPAPDHVGKRICQEVLDMIERSKAARKGSELSTPKREELSKEQLELGELIELGAHYAPMCLWPRRREGA